MWYDADIDAMMTRTAGRPIPAGRMQPRRGARLRPHACGRLGGVARPDGQLCSRPALLAFTIFFYAVVYTMWLKRWTPQNIVIGGAAGAFPPMIGWAAATGGIGARIVLLFLIIFFWTPPHFWALSLYAPTNTRAPASRCCRWSRARPRRAARSCSIRCCWRRSARCPGCSAMPACSMAWPRSPAAR